MKHFVFEFDRLTADLRVEEFSDGPQAMRRRFELERRDNPSTMEIVVIGAGSIDGIRVTHSRYFRKDRHLPQRPKLKRRARVHIQKKVESLSRRAESRTV